MRPTRSASSGRPCANIGLLCLVLREECFVELNVLAPGRFLTGASWHKHIEHFRENLMIREEMVSRIESERGPWDLVIIGGGATGPGRGIDGASRGFSVLNRDDAWQQDQIKAYTDLASKYLMVPDEGD